MNERGLPRLLQLETFKRKILVLVSNVARNYGVFEHSPITWQKESQYFDLDVAEIYIRLARLFSYCAE